MTEAKPSIPPSLYKNKKAFDAETVYEVTTKETGLPFGFAIADIDQSVPHFHKITTEAYIIVQGDLEVTLGDVKHVLHPGDAITIAPNTIHSARSLSDKPGRLVVVTIPEFSVDDYFVAEK